MQLSRRRLMLRMVLLVVGGVFMLWRAAGALRASRGTGADLGVLGPRLALVWGLVGVLALVTAASAAWSLVRRPRRRTLRLDDVSRGRPGEGEPTRRQ